MGGGGDGDGGSQNAVRGSGASVPDVDGRWGKGGGCVAGVAVSRRERGGTERVRTWRPALFEAEVG
jgi:hypothetical protein